MLRMYACIKIKVAVCKCALAYLHWRFETVLSA